MAATILDGPGSWRMIFFRRKHMTEPLFTLVALPGLLG